MTTSNENEWKWPQHIFRRETYCCKNKWYEEGGATPMLENEVKTTEYISLSEHEAIVEAKVREAVQSMRDNFTLWGSDDCIYCGDGRNTLYATLKGKCVSCQIKEEKARDAK
jgi:hypothetical protein